MRMWIAGESMWLESLNKTNEALLTEVLGVLIEDRSEHEFWVRTDKVVIESGAESMANHLLEAGSGGDWEVDLHKVII